MAQGEPIDTSADDGAIMSGLMLCVIPVLIRYIVIRMQIVNCGVTGAIK